MGPESDTRLSPERRAIFLMTFRVMLWTELPTEATVASVIVAKFADHLPLYRQAQIYARQGVDLDHSTLAAWVGKAAYELAPVYDALMADLKRSTKL
ncbi:Transposase IS66 family protein, partial [Roseovarius marisflavi]